MKRNEMTSNTLERSGEIPWLVILAAGTTGSDLSWVNAPDGPLLLPFNGRPVGVELLSYYAKQGVSDVTVVARRSAGRMIQYLQKRFGAIFNLNIHLIPDEEEAQWGPGNSLLSLISAEKDAEKLNRKLLVIFGDQLTYVDEFDVDQVTVLTDKFVASPHLSYVVTDGNRVVQKFIPKGSRITAEAPETEVGGYLFCAAEILRRAMPAERFGMQVSHVLEALRVPLITKTVLGWVDVSRWDSRPPLEANIVEPRSFNSIKIDAVRGVITKTSTDNAKIKSEIGYYRSLPPPLQIYFPRLVQFDLSASSYSIEYYPMKTASEYFVFWGLPVDSWRMLAERLAIIAQSLREYGGGPNQMEPGRLFHFYKEKCISRIEASEGAISELFAMRDVRINGRKLLGWPRIQQCVEKELLAISQNAKLSVIHGDLCFSNILFDPGSGVTRLIDPRGSFVEPGCWGDLRYDLAKLLHSVEGLYDFVVHDMFSVNRVEDEIALEILVSSDTDAVRALFVDKLMEAFPSVCFRQVRLLEGLLFLTMLPLHSNAPDRQLAFWARGIEIINSVIVGYENLH